MLSKRTFYIDGQWVDPVEPHDWMIVNPATEEPVATVSLGSAADVDRAVAAARRAFPAWAATPVEERLALLQRLVETYRRRYDEVVELITLELGAPLTLCREQQADAGIGQVEAFIAALRTIEWREPQANGCVVLREPVGVCGLITPWNWPIYQMVLKVIPALATGCTCVLKPSEFTPLDAMLYAEMIDEAGFPAGVFNLVNGDGPTVGSALSKHPDIAMMSFTGSTRAGIAVTRDAAATVKRVTLELGGKSPNLIFADADLEQAVAEGVFTCFANTGQSCDAPTRMLVERSVYERAVEIAAEAARGQAVGDPQMEGPHLGPLVSHIQFSRVQALIETGIEEGARLVVGGPGRPEGFTKGYFVRPTVFADVDNSMRIAREEIFGPVLAMIPFADEAEAIALANDTPYGLAAYVSTSDPARAERVAAQLRAGTVHINGGPLLYGTPFGGFKQSGNGREGGRFGLEDYLEVKALLYP